MGIREAMKSTQMLLLVELLLLLDLLLLELVLAILLHVFIT